jgi:hypothetical protein
MMTNAPAGAEIVLLELLALFLTAATIWFVLYAIGPDEFANSQTLWTILVVIIPFVMLIYFGPAIAICNEMVARSGRPILPTELSDQASGSKSGNEPKVAAAGANLPLAAAVKPAVCQ